MSDPLVGLLTALGDDELILGHRHSEWTGFAPHIEEDVAFSSIAQDEIGHAAALYSLVGDLIGKDANEIALGRAGAEYRNAVICERPNRDWAYTLVRHWLYDRADDLRLRALESSTHEPLAHLARKIRREERYHLLHADAWMRRIAEGPVEGRARVVEAIDGAFREAIGLFEGFEGADEAVEEGWIAEPFDDLGRRWVEETVEALDELGMPSEGPGEATDSAAEFVASSSGDLIARDGGGGVAPRPAPSGPRRGEHTPDFDSLWDVMTKTYRAHPGATW